jgi:hypothetical protein
MKEEEQIKAREVELVCYNLPVADGSHLQKTWDYCNSLDKHDPVDFNIYAVEAIRAYQGRIDAYSAVVSHDTIKLMGEVKCPVLNLRSAEDMLGDFAARVREIVSL